MAAGTPDAAAPPVPPANRALRHRTLSVGSVITWGSLIAAFAALAAGYFVGMSAHGWNHSLGYKVGSAWQAYAGLFVLAAAIERLIQPFSDVLGDAPAPGTTYSLDLKSKRNTSIVTWGVASGLACAACAVLGVGLLTAIAGSGSSTPAPALDVLVSGLVAGAGTKPLHDLITNIQATKETKQAVQAATTNPGG